MLGILLLANGLTSDRLAGTVQWPEVIAEPVLVARVSLQEVMVEVHRDVYKRGGATTADVSRALAQAGAAGLVEDRDVERMARGHSGRAMLLRLK